MLTLWVSSRNLCPIRDSMHKSHFVAICPADRVASPRVIRRCYPGDGPSAPGPDDVWRGRHPPEWPRGPGKSSIYFWPIWPGMIQCGPIVVPQRKVPAWRRHTGTGTSNGVYARTACNRSVTKGYRAGRLRTRLRCPGRSHPSPNRDAPVASSSSAASGRSIRGDVPTGTVGPATVQSGQRPRSALARLPREALGDPRRCAEWTRSVHVFGSRAVSSFSSCPCDDEML